MTKETSTIPRRIPAAVLDRFVKGVNLMPGTLRDQLGDAPTLLVFLRHFGCTFCRETVDDLRTTSERDAGFPPILFFFQGTAREGRAFLRHYWPSARAISDEALAFYDAYGVDRGRFLQMLGPGVLRAKRRAGKKGHHNGERSGDIWRMPGLLVARGDEVVWEHPFKHAADHPDFGRIPEVAGLRVAAAPTSGGVLLGRRDGFDEHPTDER